MPALKGRHKTRINSFYASPFLFVWSNATSIHRLTEKALGILAIFWGILLMLPGDLLAGIERYTRVSAYALDALWGAVYAILGAIVFSRMPSWAHKHAHWLLCTVWAGMTVMLLLTKIVSPTLLTASMCAFISFLHATKYLLAAADGGLASHVS